MRGLIGILAVLWATTVAAEPFPSDEVIRSWLRARVDTLELTTGIVVGLVDPSGTRVIGYGRTHADSGAVVSGSTIFEIGSIGKVFTSVLLADMVQRGEVKLSDPVERYLPEGVRLPRQANRSITLLDLATHRSGLPRMPDDLLLLPDARSDAYSAERMYAFLSACSLIDDIGARYYYSNLGVGLLGQALGRRAGTDYESLLIERVLMPLGLADTRIRLSPEQRSRKAGVHDWRHRGTLELEFGGMEAAGAHRSTARDLLRFLAANIGLIETDLWRALELTHLDRRDAFGPVDVGMGWHTIVRHGRELILHGGLTYGNVAFAGFDKEARRGVVVLSNTRGSVEDIGVRLLDPDTRVPDFKIEDDVQPQRAVVPIEKLEPLAGEYAIKANLVLVVSIEGDHIYASHNDGLRFELFAASERSLFTDLAPGVMDFEDFEKGRPQKVVLRYMGQEIEGERLDHYHRSPKRVASVAEDLADYVGTYRTTEGLAITIRQGEAGLTIQGDGQAALMLVRTSQGFYAWDARAELAFEWEDDRVVAATIRQDGESDRAARVEPGSEGRP